MHLVTAGFRNLRALSLSSPYTVCHLTWFSHFSCFLCVVLFPFFFSFISKRLQDSRYQGLSSKAVGPQTGKRESFQGKNGPVKKKMYILSFPPTWDAVRSQSGYSCHEMQPRKEVRPSPCTAQPSSGRRAQRERALCRGSVKVPEEKESTVMQSYWI